MKYHIEFDLALKQNSHPGLYIALEGIDGCGKTTQARSLQTYFEKKKKKVVMTSEPKVDLVGGELIMQFFRGEVSIPGQAFQYWMSANRVINHDTIVLPALRRQDVVISDRCFWSAVPYGLMDKGVTFNRKDADLMLIAQGLLSHFYQFTTPDIVFYIDIDPRVGLDRSLTKKSRRESDVYEKKDKLEKVVRGYRWLVKEFPEEFICLDGEKAIDVITENMIEIIEKKLAKKLI